MFCPETLLSKQAREKPAGVTRELVRVSGKGSVRDSKQRGSELVPVVQDLGAQT